MPSTLETKLTGLSNKIKQLVNTKANKTNGASEITDSDSDDYTHIASNMQSGATQATINDAINIKLGNVVEKSLTTGLLKNDGTVDTNTYLQSGFSSSDANKNVVTDSNGGLSVEPKPDLSGYATTSALNDKVDKVTGKDLSSNDFTDLYKTRLENRTSRLNLGLNEDIIQTLNNDYYSEGTYEWYQYYGLEDPNFLSDMFNASNMEEVLSNYYNQLSSSEQGNITWSYSNKIITITDDVSSWNDGAPIGFVIGGYGVYYFIITGTNYGPNWKYLGRNLSFFSDVAWTGSYTDLTDKPTTMTPSSHTHTQSEITDFPIIPSASSTTPSADTANGSIGTAITWAKADHTHPKSSIYEMKYKNGILYNTEKDLTTYLNNIDNYSYAQGSSSKLSKDTSNNAVKFTSSVIALNNEEFCSTNNYRLEFDWKSSLGYEGGFALGTPTNWISFTQQFSTFAIHHGNMTTEGYYENNQSMSSSQRFTDFVHVIIIRNDNTFVVDIGNQTLYFTFTSNNNVDNKFGVRCWSGTHHIKDLKVLF